MFRTLVLATALALAPLAAAAATLLDTLSVNDQPFNFSTNPGGIRFFNTASGVNGSPLGQTFTLDTETSNLTVSAYLSTFGNSIAMTARLFAGETVTGTALATRTFSLSNTNRNVATLAMFDFVSLGALDAGTYTIAFQGTGALGGSTVNVLGPNQYQGVDTPGTVALNRNGVFNFGSNPARDFGIRVEGDPSVVPLPAAGFMLMAGLGALVAFGRRRIA